MNFAVADDYVRKIKENEKRESNLDLVRELKKFMRHMRKW